MAPSPRDWIDTLMNERERERERDLRLCIDCAKAKATKNEGWSFEEGGERENRKSSGPQEAIMSSAMPRNCLRFESTSAESLRTKTHSKAKWKSVYPRGN